MQRKTSRRLVCLAWAAWLVSSALMPPAEAKPSQPNILIVLSDDLGYGDLACYGNKVVESPYLDRFAKEGLRLTSCYAAAPNCSPARTGLMTGRTPYRVGIYNWIPMFSPMHVPKSEITIATLLRNAGYATAHSGKWHLNGRFNLSGQPQPSDHGFEHWFSTQNNALPNHHDPDNFVRNGEAVGQLKGYSADLVSQEAIDWLTEKRDKTKPFFLFVCFHEPHEPIASAPKYAKKYAKFNDPAREAHHGNITQMDAAFGRLMAALDEQNLRDETLVVFTSDNGPAITAIHPYGSAGPLRSKKGFPLRRRDLRAGHDPLARTRPSGERIGRADQRRGLAAHALRHHRHRTSPGPQDRRQRPPPAVCRRTNQTQNAAVLAVRLRPQRPASRHARGRLENRGLHQRPKSYAHRRPHRSRDGAHPLRDARILRALQPETATSAKPKISQSKNPPG